MAHEKKNSHTCTSLFDDLREGGSEGWIMNNSQDEQARLLKLLKQEVGVKGVLLINAGYAKISNKVEELLGQVECADATLLKQIESAKATLLEQIETAKAQSTVNYFECLDAAVDNIVNESKDVPQHGERGGNKAASSGVTRNDARGPPSLGLSFAVADAAPRAQPAERSSNGGGASGDLERARQSGQPETAVPTDETTNSFQRGSKRKGSAAAGDVMADSPDNCHSSNGAMEPPSRSPKRRQLSAASAAHNPGSKSTNNSDSDSEVEVQEVESENEPNEGRSSSPPHRARTGGSSTAKTPTASNNQNSHSHITSSGEGDGNYRKSYPTKSPCPPTAAPTGLPSSNTNDSAANGKKRGRPKDNGQGKSASKGKGKSAKSAKTDDNSASEKGTAPVPQISNEEHYGKRDKRGRFINGYGKGMKSVRKCPTAEDMDKGLTGQVIRTCWEDHGVKTWYNGIVENRAKKHSLGNDVPLKEVWVLTFDGDKRSKVCDWHVSLEDYSVDEENAPENSWHFLSSD